MAGLTLEQLEFLAAKGLSLAETIEFAKLGKTRSAAAERQARYRARKKDRDVTNDVTRDASPPPIDNIHTPPVSSDDETKRAGKTKPGKPDDVSDPVWRDFCRQRERQKAPVSDTALAGIRREATKAGWTMDAALSESVARGWRGFKAEWVAPAEQSTGPPSGYLDYITERHRRQEHPT